MKKLNEQQWEDLLSQYVDGILSEQEMIEVESLIAMDKATREKMDSIKRLKELLGAKQKLTPDVGFWTRLSVEIDEQKRDEHSLLPFPRAYIPAIATTVAAVCVVFGMFIIQNRMQFVQYFSKKSQAVREAYEKNVLQGQLLPLFSKVDKDRVLQFSLFGTLALDDKSKTELRVDEQSEKGYRIEVGKDSKKKTNQVTFDHFLAEVKPTAEQKHLIDSLLELTGRRIESSVLLGENNIMAIAPDLPRLNRMMVTNIASCLEPTQRLKFEKLLEMNDAPYTITSQSTSMKKDRPVPQCIPQTPLDDRFVLITPDTMLYTQIHINIDSLRHEMQENVIAAELRREAMLKRMLARGFQHVPKNVPWPVPPQSLGNEEFFSVEINVPFDENEQPMHVFIQPRVRKQIFESGTQNHPIQIRAGGDTNSGIPKP